MKSWKVREKVDYYMCNNLFVCIANGTKSFSYDWIEWVEIPNNFKPMALSFRSHAVSKAQQDVHSFTEQRKVKIYKTQKSENEV